MSPTPSADRYSRRQTVANARWFLLGKLLSAAATVLYLGLLTRALLPQGQMAPYLAAIDTSTFGSVVYTSHSSTSNSSTDASMLGAIAQRISAFTNTTYNATYALVVTYVGVPPVNSATSSTGTQTEATTAQAVLTTDGSRVFLMFNYQFNAYAGLPLPWAWNATMQRAVQAGFSYGTYAQVNGTTFLAMPAMLYTLPSNNLSTWNPYDFSQTLGNTGQLGSWIFAVTPTPQACSPFAYRNATGQCICVAPYVGNGSYCQPPYTVLLPYSSATSQISANVSVSLSPSALPASAGAANRNGRKARRSRL